MRKVAMNADSGMLIFSLFFTKEIINKKRRNLNNIIISVLCVRFDEGLLVLTSPRPPSSSVATGRHQHGCRGKLALKMFKNNKYI